MRTPAQAIEHAKREAAKESRDWTRLCLMFVRICFGIGAKYPSAIAAWHGAKNKTTQTPVDKIPAGVPVFWEGGKWGHVALSLGDGKCVSNDIFGAGGIYICDIDLITRKWNYKFLGWSTDLNGKTVYKAAAPAPAKPAPKPKVGLSQSLVDWMERERALIEALNKPEVQKNRPYFARLERELARTYTALRTFTGPQFTAWRAWTDAKQLEEARKAEAQKPTGGEGPAARAHRTRYVTYYQNLRGRGDLLKRKRFFPG